MQKITPCLWFDDQAEQAAKFYTSIFSKGGSKKSKVGQVTHYGKEGFEIHGRKSGSVMTVEFEIQGQKFLALNGGPFFKFNEAVSFIVHCQTQKELDYYWKKLSAGGDESAQQCGWLKDKFGVSWQVVPAILPKFMKSRDKYKTGRLMNALLRMKKLDIELLKRAYNGR